MQVGKLILILVLRLNESSYFYLISYNGAFLVSLYCNWFAASPHRPVALW